MNENNRHLCWDVNYLPGPTHSLHGWYMLVLTHGPMQWMLTQWQFVFIKLSVKMDIDCPVPQQNLVPPPLTTVTFDLQLRVLL